MAATFAGKCPEFNVGDDWRIFIERLNQQFIALELDDEDRKAGILLTVIAEPVYKTLRNLCFPNTPADRTYKELCKILGDFHTPQFSAFKEQQKFYEAKQKSGESIAEWLARLKSLAINCKFDGYLQYVLRDKFVSGLMEGPIKDKVVEQSHNVTLEDVFQIALKKEILLVNKTQQFEVHKIKVNNKSFDHQSKDKTCFACGKSNHNFAICKFKKYKCRKCNIRGHIEGACKGQPSSKPTQKSHNFIDLFNIRDSKVDPFVIKVSVNKKMVDMEVDTGSAITVISNQYFDQHFSNEKLNETNLCLKSYTGDAIVSIGYFVANIEFQGNKCINDIVVIQNGNRPLIGRDVLKKLNFNLQIKQVNVKKDIIVNNIDYNAQSELELILQQYKDLFSDELGCYKYGKIKLEMCENTKPIFIKPRQVAHAFKDKMEAELDRLEKEGIITKITTNDWGTPLVPVLKKDGDLRICCDYRVTVNPFLKDVNYPVPIIENIFAALQGGKKFSKVDLSSAYNQLELEDSTKKLLAWSTTKGIYQVNRLPFGAKPNSAIFQSVMEKVLQGCKGTVVLLDDILITGQDDQDHINNLQQVFFKLKDAGFQLKRNKCVFFQKEVRYLGYIIDDVGLKKDKEKVKAIMEAPQPQNVTQIKSFVGMINYYGKFVPRLATLLSPIYKLLKKDVKFYWSDECKVAFQEIKDIMSSDQILVHFDQSLQVKLITDASQYGIGAILLHVFPNGDEKPIAYASRVLTKAECNYSMIDKEGLAVFYAVKKFAQYLMGRHFILLTDHKALVSIFGSKKGIPEMAAGRLQRWSVYLSSFDFSIQHIKGCQNFCADYFSRVPINESEVEQDIEEEGSYLNFINMELDDLVDINKIRVESQKDPVLRKIIHFVKYGWPENNNDDKLNTYFSKMTELSLEKEILMWGFRIIVPEALKHNLLKEIHISHLGMAKMKSLIRTYFWWNNLDKDVQDMCNSCEICLKNRPEQQKNMITPWVPSTFTFERIHIDFCGPIMGFMFLVVIDSYSKYMEVFKMKNCNSEETIIKLRECFARFDIPSVIVSDNGRQFVSKEFDSFCKMNGIRHLTTAPYSPASNGAAENAVKTFKSGVKKLLEDPANKNCCIDTIVSRFLYYYRRSEHATTGHTPFKKMFMRESRLRFNKILPSVESNNIQKQMENFNKRATNKSFNIEEEVMARDYRNPDKKCWCSAIIKKQIGKVLFEVKTSDGLKWKRHLNQLMKKGGKATQSSEIIVPVVNSNNVNHAQLEENEEMPITEHVSDIDEAAELPNKEINEDIILRRSGRRVHPPIKLNL